MAIFQGARQMAACLGDDLQAALDEPPLVPIGFKSFERDTRDYDADAPDRLDDIGEARDRGSRGHLKDPLGSLFDPPA